MAVTIAFIVLGGFNSVDQLARGFGKGPIVTGLIFAGVLTLLRMAVSLPFSAYDTFVIEQKYGFNKTSPKTFVLDLIRGTLLGMILGGLIFAGIIYFFENVGVRAWFYSWLIFTVFQVTLTFLAPVLITQVRACTARLKFLYLTRSSHCCSAGLCRQAAESSFVRTYPFSRMVFVG